VSRRLFIHSSANPYSLSRRDADHSGYVVDQPVERAATLEDVRGRILTRIVSTPLCSYLCGRRSGDRARWRCRCCVLRQRADTRSASVAIGAQPRNSWRVSCGGRGDGDARCRRRRACGYVLVRLARSAFENMQTPSALPVVGSVFILLAAAVVAQCGHGARRAWTSREACVRVSVTRCGVSALWLLS